MLNSPNCAEQDGGETLFGWASDLYPICRSITGNGLRQTLDYFNALLPDLRIHSVPSGTSAFDWTVPDEWNIRDAFIADLDGNRIVDFRRHNLHVVGYSESVQKRLKFRDFEGHLHHLPEQPDAIPYVTSYYARTWGFCLTHNQYLRLSENPDREYDIVINASLAPGEMNYADFLLPGDTEDEILFSTYVCHPSMANNELSGPCVQVALARWIEQELPQRRYSYRFYFGPETIGPIYYLSQHLNQLRQHVAAGFVVSCLGDTRGYSCVTSRRENTLADRVALHVLRHTTDRFKIYSFLDRGSDERQYGSPGVDLPVVTLCRSKFMEYPEYHTSLDDLSLISAKGLEQSLDWLKNIVMAIESNCTPRSVTPCEPQLGKRGLYPSLSTKQTRRKVRAMMDLLAYADGERDLLGIAEKIGKPISELSSILEELVNARVITINDRDC